MPSVTMTLSVDARTSHRIMMESQTLIANGLSLQIDPVRCCGDALSRGLCGENGVIAIKGAY